MKRLAQIGALKLSSYLEARGKLSDELLKNYNTVLKKGVTQKEIEECLASVSFNREILPDSNLLSLLEITRNNVIAGTVLELSLLLYLYPEVSTLLTYVYSKNSEGVMIETAARVATLKRGYENIRLAWEAYDLLTPLNGCNP